MSETELKITLYRKSKTQPMMPWHSGMNMESVSIPSADAQNGSPKAGDMIAYNPEDSGDRWLVSAEFFRDNYEPADQPRLAVDSEKLIRKFEALRELHFSDGSDFSQGARYAVKVLVGMLMSGDFDSIAEPRPTVPEGHCLDAGHREYAAKTGEKCSCPKYVRHPDCNRVEVRAHLPELNPWSPVQQPKGDR